MKRDPAPQDAELHEAADGRMTPAHLAALEARLAAEPEAAARLAFYRQLNEVLHRLYDPVLDEPYAPPALAPRRRWGPILARAAAVAALLVVGAGGGWLARHRLDDAPGALAGIDLPRLAADAHLVYAAEIRHPVEVGAEQEAHLVQWLSKRLGGEIRAPRLDRLGYRLMGGRLLPAGAGAAGQFMYENPAGIRLTLFLVNRPHSDDSAFRFVEEDGVSVFYWRDEGFGYALSAELPREALLAICNEVYSQLSPDAPAFSWGG